MPAARPTEAQIVRAIRAAKREGWGVVEIHNGAIRILAIEPEPVLPSPKAGGTTCNEVFGCDT